MPAITKLKGLYTYPNPLGSVPAGSMVIADNIVIDAEGAAQSRRGLDTLTETFGSAGSRINKLFSYQNHLLAHYDTSNLAYRTNGVSWTDFSGTYSAIDSDNRVRSTEAASNFYFTTSSGVYKLDAYNGTPAKAGGYRALDVTAALSGSSGYLTNNSVLTTTGTTHSNTTLDSLGSTTGVTVGMYVAGTNIPDGTTVAAIVSATQVTLSASATGSTGGGAVYFLSGAQVAYRVVWGIKDANSLTVLGAPSQREILTNTTSGTRDASLTITIPSGITTNHFFQVYRSPQTVTAGTEPNDELQLVYEKNPTSGEVSAGTLTFTDSVPDSLRGAFIYTAASQEGILQSNDAPRLAKDIAHFRDSVFYANTTGKHSLTLTLLSVSGASGLASGDTITIDGVAYLADSSTENATLTPPKFKVYSTGTVAQNIRDTALSLIRVINKSALTTTIYAYYLSGYSDLPGKIQLEKRSVGGSSFAVTLSAHGGSFDPTLPTAGTSISSTAETQKNALYISKAGKPEAVPTTNVLFAGSAAYDIKRIIPLRDSMFIFKDDGIFKVIGQTPSDFYVTLVDDTTKLLAPESAVNLNNTIYCLSNQGVASVSDTGVQIVSRQIEGDLLEILGASLDNVKQLTFGVSYQSDRKYIMGIISNSGDTTPSQLYVYNILTQSWTRWPLSKRCGIVNITDDKLYLGDATTNTVNVERKTFSYADYIEGATSVTISSSSGTTITLASVADISVGDLLYQSSTVRSVVTAISGSTNSVTVQDTLVWSAGAATVYSAINCVIQFQPQTGSEPQSAKQFSQLELFFKRARFNSASVSFYSDISQSTESLTCAGVNNGGWGLFPWGSVPWGGDLRPLPIRMLVPRNKQRCSQLNIKFTHRVAYGDFLLDGFSLNTRHLSTRTTRAASR